MSYPQKPRVLIYKRTHSGDPDPKKGVFGNHDCMGTVRGWNYDAIIGVGGIGADAKRNGLARKLTWIGIGPHKSGDKSRPRVRFDHFLYYGEEGPLLKESAPKLAKRMYEGGVRVIFNCNLTPTERREVDSLLEPASNATPSGTRNSPQRSKSGKSNSKGRSTSCHCSCRVSPNEMQKGRWHKITD